MIKSKITLLLGAGATKPWGGLLTNEMTKIVLKTPNSLTKISSQPIGFFLQDVLAKYYQCEPNNINFEIILNAIEYLYEFYREKNLPNPIWTKPVFPGLFEIIDVIDQEINNNITFGGTDSNHNKSIFLHNCYKEIIQNIICNVKNYSNKFKESDYSFNTSFAEFINYLNNKYIIRAYTLNYDNIFKEIEGLPDFYNGFNLIDGVDRYNYKNIILDSNINCFYNLHGSIFFESESIRSFNTNGIPSFEYQFTFNTDTIRFGFDIPPEDDNIGRSLIISPIITGQQKLLKTLIEPFNAYNHSFRRDCLESDFIMLIGYSFSDGHIFNSIKNAIKFNPNLKLLKISKQNLFGIEPYFISVLNGSERITTFWNGFEDFLNNQKWQNINKKFTNEPLNEELNKK